MNAAICISGFVRSKINNFTLFDNLINYNKHINFDIFIDTWNTYNTENSHAFVRRNDNNFDTVDFNMLIENYNPVSICVEQYNPEMFKMYSHYKGSFDNISSATFSQFYKVQKCKNLMVDYLKTQNNKFYDYVIRTRFDLNYNKITYIL